MKTIRSPVGETVASASYPGVLVIRRRLVPSARAKKMSYPDTPPRCIPREIRQGRAPGTGEVRRGEENRRVAGEEIAAGRPTLPGTHHVRRSGGEFHDELLVAVKTVPGRLKDQLLLIERKIGLGVLSPERQLPEGGEMPLRGKDQGWIGSSGNPREQQGKRNCCSENNVHQVTGW